MSKSMPLSSNMAEPTKKVENGKKVEPKVSFVPQVIKGDTYMVLSSSALTVEDEFHNAYYTQSSASGLALMPPFLPTELKHWVVHNNILNQCVEAMEVNIDGTGQIFVPIDESEQEPDAAELKKARAFFQEPYPGKSFMQIRRRVRRDLESVGYGYLEVIRDMKGTLVGLRNVETNNVRFVKLDEPVMVEKELQRGDETFKMRMYERERRYVQKVNQTTNVFYRDFGTTRELNRDTGEWESPENPISPEKRGSELLLFTVNPDVDTPYSLPRWINQIPSVVGSRKAEEQNLEFFDAGGMPPAIIFVQGGVLAKDAADQLRAYLSGLNRNRNRAVVVEVQSSSGTLESTGQVQVKVERFGAERANDAMYANYDKAAEDRVRMGFRLPPLFLGKAADYNFATAVTAYMVAEAQVFEPERKEFDEIINKTVMKELGFKKIRMKSNQITLKDVAQQLVGMGMIKEMVEPESFVEEINRLTGVSLEYKEPEETPPGLRPAVLGPDGQPVPLINHQDGTMVRPHERTKPDNVVPINPAQRPASSAARPMKKSSKEVVDLVQEYLIAENLAEGQMSDARKSEVLDEVADLMDDDLFAFQTMLSSAIYGRPRPDLIHQAHDH